MRDAVASGRHVSDERLTPSIYPRLPVLNAPRFLLQQ